MSMNNLTDTERQTLIRLWKNLETVIAQLPVSDITTLLAFHCRNALDYLAASFVERSTLAATFERVSTLVRTSPVELGIDDILAPLSKALAS